MRWNCHLCGNEMKIDYSNASIITSTSGKFELEGTVDVWCDECEIFHTIGVHENLKDYAKISSNIMISKDIADFMKSFRNEGITALKYGIKYALSDSDIKEIWRHCCRPWYV